MEAIKVNGDDEEAINFDYILCKFLININVCIRSGKLLAKWHCVQFAVATTQFIASAVSNKNFTCIYECGRPTFILSK